MSEVYVLVMMEEYDEAEGVEPVVRVYGDPEDARAASGDAMASNDYVALEVHEVIG